MASEQLLPEAVRRNLSDKLYEKRKAAALEVEQARAVTSYRLAPSDPSLFM